MTLHIDVRHDNAFATSPVVVIGAGGLGEEVRDAIEASGREFTGFLDDRSDVNAIGPVEQGSVPPGSWAILAIGDPVLRWRLASRFVDFDRWAVVVHPSAVISPHANVGSGTFVGALAYVGPRAEIGRHVVINVHAEVGHHARVSDNVTLSPLAALNGDVRLGEGVFLGTSASVEPRLTIGPWTRIAATAHVTESAGEGMLLLGNPAKGRRLFRSPAGQASLSSRDAH